jgi:hypothetical protein
MGRFIEYAPEQAWLLPPRISDELVQSGTASQMTYGPELIA